MSRTHNDDYPVCPVCGVLFFSAGFLAAIAIVILFHLIK